LYTASEHYRDAGRSDLAVEFLHRAGVELTEEYGKHPSATYENGLALGSILLNNHRAIDKAEDVYRKTIALEPGRYDGVHELAATLQAGNRTEDALEAVLNYMSSYGESQDAITDRSVLLNSLDKREANAAMPGDTANADTNQSGAEDTGGS
jgi:tetratricopeptide (TPR) repeat protein